MEQVYTYYPWLAFLSAFAITYFSIPAIIRLSMVKRLYDLPDHRKKHGERISSLGGLAIFGGLLVSFIFFSAHLTNPTLSSVLVAIVILFVTGVKDDLYPLSPYKKVLGQLLSVAVVIFQGDVRLISMYGFFGIYDLPYFVSVALTTLFFLAIINSFNFIDGINGLGSSIGIVVSATYAYWFHYLNEPLFLILALSICGSQLAFLPYNLVRAKIFMGDSGSLILGFFAALLTIYFLQANQRSAHALLLYVDAMMFALAVLIIPVIDTARVIFMRIFILRRSPFNADRNHIHHVLLDIGLSHLQATGILFTTNVFFIGLTYFLNDYLRARYLFILVIGLAILLSQIPFYLKQIKKKKGEYHPAQAPE